MRSTPSWRRNLSAFCATAAAVSASLTYTSFQARSVLASPDAMAAAADEVLADPAVIDALTASISDSIEESTIGQPVGFQDGYTATLSAEIDEIARQAVTSPTFHNAFRDAVISVHAYMLESRTVVPTLDMEALNAEIQQAAQRVDPTIAAMIGTSEVQVEIPTENLPDLTKAPGTAQVGLWLSGFFAVLFTYAALALHSLPEKVLRRLGRWGVVTGSMSMLSAFVVPALLGAKGGDTAVYAEPFLRSLASRFVGPGIALLAAGVALLVIARQIGVRRRATERPVILQARPVPQGWSPPQPSSSVL